MQDMQNISVFLFLHIQLNIQCRRAFISDQLFSDEIFQRIFEDEEKFPIASVGGLRCTDTMRHAWGAAVDINPDANCAADRVDGAVKITVGQGWWPLGTEKSEWAGTLAEPSPYSIAAGGSVVRAFAAYGWGWGGTWQSSRDFMHFSVRTDGG